MAAHVPYNSWYISLSFSTKQQRERTKFCVDLEYREIGRLHIKSLFFLLDVVLGVAVVDGGMTDYRQPRSQGLFIGMGVARPQAKENPT